MALFVFLGLLLPGLLGAKCGSPVPPSAVPLTVGQAQAMQQPAINELMKHLILETNNAWTYYGTWDQNQQTASKTRRTMLSQNILLLKDQGQFPDLIHIDALAKAVKQYQALVCKQPKPLH